MRYVILNVIATKIMSVVDEKKNNNRAKGIRPNI